MSCRVSSSFKKRETISKMPLNQLFHFSDIKFLKQPLNQPRWSSCFRVSELSIYIPLISETAEKVLGRSDRERKNMIVGRQDSTRLDPCSLQDCSLQHEVLCEVGVSW